MASESTGKARGRPKTKEYVTMLARVPAELAALVKRYSANHGKITLSTLIREGLEWRVGDGDPRGTGLYLDEPGGIREQVYHSNTGNSTAAPQTDEALQEVRALLARQWEQIQALAQALERHTASGSNGAYDSNTAMPASAVAVSYQEASYTEVATLTDEQIPESTIPATVPAFDTTRYYMGKLCPKGHDFGGTGLSLLRKHKQRCRECENEDRRERRQAKRQQGVSA